MSFKQFSNQDLSNQPTGAISRDTSNVTLPVALSDLKKRKNSMSAVENRSAYPHSHQKPGGIKIRAPGGGKIPQISNYNYFNRKASEDV